MPALVATTVLRSEYSMPATKAIGWFAMADAVTGASAVVAISAPPPITVSRHCLPVVKFETEISSPCCSNRPFDLAMIARPEIGPRFCASRAFSNSAADPDAAPKHERTAISAATKVALFRCMDIDIFPRAWWHSPDDDH